MKESRFIIGVDLGTSNCALSYIDTYSSDLSSKTLLITQRDSESSESRSELLPSYLYLAPDDGHISGKLAKEMTSSQSDRVIESAKSWLCYDIVDRDEGFLPWNSESVEAKKRLSPIDVSAEYLRHLKRAWDEEFAELDEGNRLEYQTVIVTVPASFDEVAQKLTLEAARRAGYPESTSLIEEPLSAFYYFLEHSESLLTADPDLRARPLSLLVVDVGGGTSDFTIIELDRNEELRRVAVSPHLLIGGINIDLTLTHLLEQQAGEKLSRRRWSYLLAQARGLKERILSQGVAHERYTITIPGEGSSLFASPLVLSITGEELMKVILDGFFPYCSRDDRPQSRTGGLREWGLPFPADSAITRHLAAFIDGRGIDATLYTGGTLKPEVFQERLSEVITSWQDRAPVILPNLSLDLAVAHGAARYGVALREKARRVVAGYSHSLYLKLNEGYLCILKRGALAGSSYTVENRQFKATVGVPVQFQLASSFSRPDDEVGDLILNFENPHLLPPLQTVLEPKVKGEKEVQVELHLSLGETGILTLSCREEGTEREWNLEFNLRRQQKASGPPTGVATDKRLEKASLEIAYYYGKKREIDEKRSPKRLFNELESALGTKREDWGLDVLRGLWPSLAPGMTRRNRSLAHETTWLALAGYLLRPGYGAELDEFRIAELWRCHELGLMHRKENSALLQWWIMWRRVAGGLNKEQQLRLYQEVQPLLWKQIEVLRLVGSLERIPVDEKIRIGGKLVKMLHAGDPSTTEHHLWALGRLTSRVPLYAGAQSVIPGEQIEEWFSLLSKHPWSNGISRRLNSIFAHAARATGDRSRDLSEDARAKVRKQLNLSGAKAEERALLDAPVEVSFSEKESLFGEALPAGLRLVNDS